MNQPVPVLIGRGSVKKMVEKLKEEYHCRRVALVFGNGVKHAGIIDFVLTALNIASLEYLSYDHMEQDAPDYNVDELGKFLSANHCNAVIAIGGGSTLDTAKGGALVACNGGSIRDYMIQRPARLAGTDSSIRFQHTQQHQQALPLIAIPTTSGSGSEMRLTGVIYDTELHMKDIIEYTPALAVQDPELLTTMPAFITATTAFDAMAHANESMTSCIGKQKLRNIILGAGVTQAVFEWLPVAISEPDNLVAREKLAVASTLAALCSLDGLAHVGHNAADSLNYNFIFPMDTDVL